MNLNKKNKKNSLVLLRTWRISCGVSPMKGRPMVPGGRGLVQLGSSPRVTKICHSFTAAKSSSTGSTTVHIKVTSKV